MSTKTISPADRAARERRAAAAVHSIEMEGGQVSAEQHALLQSWARGDLTGPELDAATDALVARMIREHAQAPGVTGD